MPLKPRMSRYFFACLIDHCNMHATCRECSLFDTKKKACSLHSACDSIEVAYRKVAKTDGKRLKESYSNMNNFQSQIDF